MDLSSSIDRDTHKSVLVEAAILKRTDLVDIAVRHIHSPPGQPVNLNMVDDTLLQEYRQLVQAKIQSSQSFLNNSNHGSSPATSIRSGDSAASKSSQTSYDPRDQFDQVLYSMIDRLNILMPAIKGTKFNRLVGSDRSRRTSLAADLRGFRDKKLKSHFGMSDRPRRRRIDSNEFSGEYLRRRDIYYTEILDIQDQLFRVRESENISRKETLRDDQVTNVRSKLEIWGARLTMMAEEMRNAPLVDDSEAPEAQMSDAMEVDET